MRAMTGCTVGIHTSVMVSLLLSKRSFLSNVLIYGGKWKLVRKKYAGISAPAGKITNGSVIKNSFNF